MFVAILLVMDRWADSEVCMLIGEFLWGRCQEVTLLGQRRKYLHLYHLFLSSFVKSLYL